MKLTVVLVVAAVSATLSSARSTVPTMVYFVNHPLVGSISDEEAAASVASVNTNLRWVPPTVPEKCYVSDHRGGQFAVDCDMWNENAWGPMSHHVDPKHYGR